jgi:hypothetical protein
MELGAGDHLPVEHRGHPSRDNGTGSSAVLETTWWTATAAPSSAMRSGALGCDW